MQIDILRGVTGAAKRWHLPMTLGMLFIVVSVWIFLTPVFAFHTLSVLFAITFLLAGIAEITEAVSNRKFDEHWGWSLTIGVIDVLIGILLAAKPMVSIMVLPYYIGCAMLFRSVRAIGWSIALKRQNLKKWISLLIIAILGAAFAFICLWNPWFADMAVTFYTALAFAIVGVFQLYLSFTLKSLDSPAEQ